MKLSIIVAASENNVIGKNNDLPWHLPADLKYFKDTTMGHCVVLGRKNFESIPPKFSPLKGRINIVITRQKDYQAPGAVVVNSIEQAIEYSKDKNETECFITGGGEIFRQSLMLCDRVYLTRIHSVIEGDIFFPELNMKMWKEISRRDNLADEKNKYPFSFIVYERVPG